VVGPIARRNAVGWLLDAQKTSLRRACRLVGLSTATWRYQRHGRVDNAALLERLQAHGAVRARYGYRRLHTLVAREGMSRITNGCTACTARPGCRSAAVGASASRGRIVCRCPRRTDAASDGR
jgi:hypothetical protein